MLHEAPQHLERRGRWHRMDALRREVGRDLGMACQHADLGDGPPVDRQGRLACGLAMLCQGIQKGAGGGIVRLAGGSEQRAGRGKQHEVLERQAGRGAVQIPGADGLRGHHPGEAFRRELLQQSVIQRRRGMKDAPQRRQALRDRSKDAFHGLGIGHVRLEDEDLGTEPPQARERAPGFDGCRATASHQHQVARTARDEPLGEGEAEAAEAAGDEIGSAAREGDRSRWRWPPHGERGFRQGQDDLADMPPLGHRAERRRGLGDQAGAVRQRLQLAAAKALEDFLQDGLDEIPLGQHDLTQVDAEQGEIVAEGTQAYRAVRVDIAFADLQESTARGKDREAPLDRLTGQRIEHDVHAATPREAPDPVGECRGS